MFADEGDRGRKFCKASQVRINSLMFYDIGLHSFIKALVQITEYIQRTSLTKFLRLSKSLQAELSFRDVQSFTGQVKIQIGFFDVFVRLSFCTLLGSKLVISNVDKTVMPTTADLQSDCSKTEIGLQRHVLSPQHSFRVSFMSHSGTETSLL